MDFKMLKIFLFSFLIIACTAQDDATDEDMQADDPSSDWVAPGSTDDVIKVKTNTDVRVIGQPAPLPSSQWNTIQTGQTLVVRNWPCKVTSVSDDESSDQNVELSNQPSDDSTNTNVNVKVKVDVTTFQIGGARCLVVRRKNLIQRLSCSSSDQCPDSGTVCKRVTGFGGSTSVNVGVGVNVNADEEDGSADTAADYADPVNDAENMDSTPANDDLSNDFSDAISEEDSTSSALAVKTNVDVRVKTTRRVCPPAVWPTLKKGETLLVRNQICVIHETDQPDLLIDRQACAQACTENDEADSDVKVKTKVKVNTKVTANTVLAIGPLRCVIQPPTPRLTGHGWCVCDSIARFACKTDIECAQRWGNGEGASAICIPTFACPIKGRTGYCRFPATQVLSDVMEGQNQTAKSPMQFLPHF